VSRKITKFINRLYSTNQEQLQIACQEFISSVKSFLDFFKIQNIYNADGSGFNLEIHSGRTLTTQDVKTVETVIQSQLAITHSYTIMPTISANRQLLLALYLVVKETSGSFGLRVEETLFRPANVFYRSIKIRRINCTTLSVLIYKFIFSRDWKLQCVIITFLKRILSRESTRIYAI